MNTTAVNFNTVNELLNSSIKNSSMYLEMAHSFAKKANELEATTESWFAKKACQEVVLSWRKCENSDCEYSSYVNANAAEKWLEKAIEADNKMRG